MGHHELPPRPQDSLPTNYLSAHSFPPLPPPTEQLLMYHFGGDSYRPDRESQPRYREQNDFSFRQNSGHTTQFPEGEANNSSSTRHTGRFGRQNTGPHYKRSQHNAYRDSRGDRQENGGNRYGRGRGRGFPATAERPLLRSKRGSTPEQMTGMTLEQSGHRRFIVPEDIDDSDEQGMEESEQGTTAQSLETKATAELTSDPINAQALEEASEPAHKKRVTEVKTDACAPGGSAPQWSNPDPYTVLPPPDESQKKRKDVVKLIRKARIAAEQDVAPSNALVANDDFISLNFENEVQDVHNGSDEAEVDEDRGVPGAPSGPRPFSHLNALHGSSPITAPGATVAVVSAASLGPPPGIGSAAQANSTKSADDVWPPPNTEAAFGNRKRTRDDQIKTEASPQPKKKKGGKGPTPDGSVVEEWEGDDTPSDTPWCVTNYSRVENIGHGLHQEICDFYDFVRPREFEDLIRHELLKRLRYIVSKGYEYCDVRCFGSFAAGLYLPNADMDLVVVSDAFMDGGRQQICQTKTQIRRFASFLNHERVPEPGSVEMIFGAKVPLIKFVDRMTGLRVDLSFENDTGIVANRTFSTWKAQFPAMPIIVTIVKQFLMMRGLNDVATGGLGGFSVTCLVTSLLQNMPEVQRGTLIPEHHLGLILMEFFNLYGNEFNTTTTGIRMSPPYYFDKRRVQDRPYQMNKLHRLAIIDPNKPENDISGGTRNILTILEHFSQAHQALQQRMAALSQADITTQGTESILETILAGNYTSFKTQRNRLRHLYEERFGVLDTNALPDYVRAEVVNIARVSDQGQGESTAQSSRPQMTTRRKGGPRKKGKGKPVAEQRPPGASQTDDGHLLDKEASRRRATALKTDYPGIEDVPMSVSRNMKKLLIASYQASHPDALQDRPGMQARFLQSQSFARGFRGGKKSNPLRTESQDPASLPQGHSADNPIDLE